MATSSIYELLPAFKERNRTNFMLLGLLSVSQEWMEMLEAEVTEERRSGESHLSQSTGQVTIDEDLRGFLYFLLGTVSFSSQLHRTLENARLNGQSSLPQARQHPTWEDIRELLR